MSQKAIFLQTILLLLSATFICDSASASSAKRKLPINLDEYSWTRLLEGEWMFDLYAPWCPACRKLEPEWRKLAEWSDELNVNVASADVTTNPALSGRFLVRGLPTIYHVKDGVFRIYNGPREHTALINFIEEQGWKNIEPVSRWLAPNTLQMTFLAYSFQLSMAIRDLHNYVVDQLGVPYYISYLLFAVGTVGLGIIVGLIIICAIDQFCPPRFAPPNAPAPESKKKARTQKSHDSDLEDNTETADSKAEPKKER